VSKGNIGRKIRRLSLFVLVNRIRYGSRIRFVHDELEISFLLGSIHASIVWAGVARISEMPSF